MTTITIVAHLEWAADAQEFCWWAESDDLPGFTAVYPSLGELQRESENAVVALACEDESPVEIRWVTTGDVPAWAASHISLAENRVVSQIGQGTMIVLDVGSAAYAQPQMQP